MYKVMKLSVCRGCVNPVTSTGCTSLDIGVNANLELVDKFFTARCTTVQSAVLLSHVACPSVCPSVTLVDHDHIC